MRNNQTNATLQKIQSLLDERSAEYTVQDALPGWLITVEHPTETWTYKICIHATGLIEIWGSHITPEQAIAATLGSEREKALEELVREMWREITTCPDYRTPPCMTKSICERIRELEIEVN